MYISDINIADESLEEKIDLLVVSFIFVALCA